VETWFDIVGQGKSALLLPALSSISSRAEMRALAHALADAYRCFVPDWPGFGLEGRRPAGLVLRPELLLGFLREFTAREAEAPMVVIAAGHGAAYVLTVAGEQPERFSHLILVAPTWRGPLPTAMGNHRRPLWGRIRKIVEAPVIGPALFRLNMSGPVIRKMMRAHVYADPSFVTPELMRAKTALTRRRDARFATAAFVTGGLDLVEDREPFLRLFDAPALPPTLALIGASTPRKSRADMDAVAALPQLHAQVIPGALAAHEEHPQAVADAVRRFTQSDGATLKQVFPKVAAGFGSKNLLDKGS
jgi:pimeloyl-ACP methyl ester carboxylesterase